MSELQFSREEFHERIERLRAAMRARGVDVMLLDDSEIMAYFTGYERSLSFYRACIVPLFGEPVMVLRALDVEPFREQSWVENCVGYADTASGIEVVTRVLRERGFGSVAIGLDLGSHAMTVATYERFRAVLPSAQIVAMNGVPWELRLIKSPQEVDYLRRASEIADQTLGEIVQASRSGVSERDMSTLAARRYVELGGDPGPVGPITSGNGWGFLHGHLHDVPLRQGDILHIELVPRFKGYSGRLMRSVVIGTATSEQERDAAVLCAAQDKQIAAMRPAMRASDIDAILRQEVLKSGLRDSYENITGYTLGYYSHQPLRSSDFTRVFTPDANWLLEAGMVFHMYTSARGFAFSETILVTTDGAERLTKTERKLFTSGASGGAAPR